VNLYETFVLLFSLLAQLLHEVVILSAHTVDLRPRCIHLALEKIVSAAHFTHPLLKILLLQSMILFPVFLTQ